MFLFLYSHEISLGVKLNIRFLDLDVRRRWCQFVRFICSVHGMDARRWGRQSPSGSCGSCSNDYCKEYNDGLHSACPSVLCMHTFQTRFDFLHYALSLSLSSKLKTSRWNLWVMDEDDPDDFAREGLGLRRLFPSVLNCSHDWSETPSSHNIGINESKSGQRSRVPRILIWTAQLILNKSQ